MEQLPLAESRRLYDEAVGLIPAGTQTLSKRPEAFAFGAMPMYLERGAGCHVWDVDGNRYIDFISALGPITLGYCYPAVDDAVRAQLARGSIFSMMHPLEVDVAQALVDAVPCAEMVRFFKTGAEATCAAARVARAFTGRDLIVSAGYHGWLDTWTAERSGPSGRGVPACMKQTIAGFSFGAVDGPDSLEAVLAANAGSVAAVILEPVSYSNPDTCDDLRRVRELATSHGAVLIFDEIVSGFRVARGGAQELYGITPDLACFAKGISNGFPLAAVAGRRDVMQVAADLLISSTYGGDAISLAAAAACLREYKDRDVTGHMRSVGGQIVAGLNAVAEETGLRLQFRGHPMMSSFAFGYEDAALNNHLMTMLLGEMAKRGILLRRGGLVFITYSHGCEEVNATVEAARQVFPLLKQVADSGSFDRASASAQSPVQIRRL